jgi:tetratricopeptide (TPR) repeat protein
LIAAAWAPGNEVQRITLARKALQVDPDCVDAYLILAEYQADSPQEALTYLTKAVEAGRRSLGPATFSDDVGHFWGLLETRPFMLAMAGQAQVLAVLGAHDEAILVYQEMRRLNPDDNQGIRYPLLTGLLRQARLAEARALLDEYDDPSAAWLYPAALRHFKQDGPTPASGESLRAALDQNSFVPAYLLKRRRLPKQPPETIGFGDNSEAVAYVLDGGDLWRSEPGALDWLKANLP